jgi:hypothetical protein
MATDVFTTSNVHVDTDLTNFAVAWGSSNFIADRVCPVVPVTKKSDTYIVFGKEVFNAESDHQGDRDYPKEVERTFERRSYECERHALREWSGDAEKNNADAAVQRALSETAIVEYLKAKILLNKEVSVKTLLDTSGNYDSALYENMDTVANRNFDDSSGPGALNLILSFKEGIMNTCGWEPNIGVVSSDAWPLLATDTSFFGGGATNVRLTQQQLAEILGLDEIIVASARYSSGKVKAGTAPTLSRLWTSNCLRLLYSPRNVSLDVPATCKTFQYRSTQEYNVNGEFVGRVRDPLAGDGGDWIVYKQFYVPKLTALDSSSNIISGALLANIYNSI